MNIVNKLTLRQMKLNKKRTIVTILGTIISAAMITAVSLLALCFMDLMKRETIARDGEWHVLYMDVNREQLQAIRADSGTKNAMMSRDLGYAHLPLSENLNKPYLFIKEYDGAGFDNFPMELKEGRLPKEPGELVISDAVYTNTQVKYAIGDVLTLTIGQRYPMDEAQEMPPMLQNYSLLRNENQVAEYLTEDMTRTFTIVGIIKRPTWEYTWSPGYTTLTYMDDTTVTEQETFDVYVTAKRVNQKLFARADRLASDLGIRSYRFHDGLLRTYGAIKDDTMRGMLYTLSAIIMGIIVIGSISLIYNAFAISVSERSRHLGMMSSVGATKKQKRNSVFFEGAIIGAISIPIGIAAGHLGLGITFICINPILQNAVEVSTGLRLGFHPSSILVATLVSVGTIFISTYIPARKASRISAIDAIRQSADVKVTRRQVRTWRLTRKIFGIEGELGLKNLKRNKKRYKATVFSLMISMILFLVVSSFTQNLKKALYLSQDGVNFDIMANVDGNTAYEKEELINRMNSLEGITESSVITSLYTTAWIPVENTADFLLGSMPFLVEDGKFPYSITLNVLGDEALKRYAKEAEIEYLLESSEQNNAIVINQIRYGDNDLGKYVDARVVNSSLGDELELSYYSPESDSMLTLGPLKVASLTGVMPMGLMPHGKDASFHILISKETFARITEGVEISNGLISQVYFRSKEPLKLQERLEELQNQVGVGKLSMYNLYSIRQMEENLILLLSVFTYAFIILITSICAANILNTVSTSIALRKREFAMLKSVGITPKSFRIMLNYECIFYGIKSLIYGLPLSVIAMLMIHRTLMRRFEFAFTLPVNSILIVIISVFLLVSTAMLYATGKVKKENIIDALKQEII